MRNQNILYSPQSIEQKMAIHITHKVMSNIYKNTTKGWICGHDLRPWHIKKIIKLVSINHVSRTRRLAQPTKEKFWIRIEALWMGRTILRCEYGYVRQCWLKTWHNWQKKSINPKEVIGPNLDSFYKAWYVRDDGGGRSFPRLLPDLIAVLFLVSGEL